MFISQSKQKPSKATEAYIYEKHTHVVNTSTRTPERT